jgi:predicted aminopeptidase|tara:strand:+ start:369 stop:1424 length:1056 start_codon:yes stop_codon:yes gene_type:complete
MQKQFPLRVLPVLLWCILLGGCESIGFYQQALFGQIEILIKREPIRNIVSSVETAPPLKARLILVESVREYAENSLSFPVGNSYATYVDTGRPYVVWNVFAAPEFSLDASQWCFPIAGCVSYRGYFHKEQADSLAAKLKSEGNDVYVGGVSAYSTLGWFSDPVLNTFLKRSESKLAALIFHELAHKILYLPGDSMFNESFATAVENEALRRWLNDREQPQAYQEALDEQVRRAEFVSLVDSYKVRLRSLYEQQLGDTVKRERKRDLIQELRDDYRVLKSNWHGHADFDAWIASDINNAKIATISTYYDLVPAFNRLLKESGGNLQIFLDRCKDIADKDEAERNRLLGWIDN